MQLSSKNLNWISWCYKYNPYHMCWVVPLFSDFLCVCSYCLVLETPQKPWAHIVICMKPCCFECLVTISTFFPNMFSAVKITWRFLHFTQLCVLCLLLWFFGFDIKNHEWYFFSFKNKKTTFTELVINNNRFSREILEIVMILKLFG